ncbi:MAG: M28 family peptidase, partial [Planctomycetes bacterium]|nr:M28 family peptidase [Planctomycetota bacterium]
RTIRFIAFANEEGMRWGREQGGSWWHAAAARSAGEDLRAALILDSLACYDGRPGSQAWPAWWMPWVHGRRGDFLCVQAAWRDRALARRCAAAARIGGLPVRGCWWPGQTWQLMGDQESFTQHGIPAIALTDTDRFRNPRFHSPSDTPASLDWLGLGRAVEAASAVLDLLEGV